MLLVDPPGGWKYGFPKPFDEDKGLRVMLEEAGYPDRDIELALEHSRYWEHYDQSNKT